MSFDISPLGKQGSGNVPIHPRSDLCSEIKSKILSSVPVHAGQCDVETEVTLCRKVDVQEGATEVMKLDEDSAPALSVIGQLQEKAVMLVSEKVRRKLADELPSE